VCLFVIQGEGEAGGRADIEMRQFLFVIVFDCESRFGFHCVCCRWCRAAKLLVENCGLKFKFVDVDEFGGPPGVRQFLSVSHGVYCII